MARYLITRHGSNTANQSMTQHFDVALVEADNAEDALLKAEQLAFTVYNNQYLSARHSNSVPARVRAFEQEQDA